MTELIWSGKYEDGKKRGPVRIALPFQTVETVNESTQDRWHNLELFARGADPEWRDRLIWGDKKYVLPSLLPDFAGKINLIYIDPPFDTGANFSFSAAVPGDPEASDDEMIAFTKEPSILEQKAYRDTWGRGLNSYLGWFYETVVLLRELLAETGSFYVHLDWRMVHYAKVVLDEVFGIDRYENEIIWRRSLPHGNIDYKFGASHDTILRYSKTEEFVWNPQHAPHREEYLRDFYKYTEPNGRRYRLISCINPNPDRPNLTYDWKGVKRVWKFSKERMRRMDSEGLLVYSKHGIPSYKGYLDEMRGVPLQDIWTDISPLMGGSQEWVEYPTQKPVALLERILRASSNEGDLVMDCFVGSGTTVAAAEKLNRRWIGCDLGRFAIHTTRKRLLGIKGVRPFVVQNLGKYERQAWQLAEFPTNGRNHIEERREREAAYQRFILDLYNAKPFAGYSWLHGSKAGRLVHVAAVDAPVTQADVKAIAREAWKAVAAGKDSPTKAGADILGWEFALEVNELAKQVAAESRVTVCFKKIPREVLDKKAVDQGDVRFGRGAVTGINVSLTNTGHSVAKFTSVWSALVVDGVDNPQTEQDRLCRIPKNFVNIESDYGHLIFPNQPPVREFQPTIGAPEKLQKGIASGLFGGNGKVGFHIVVCVDYRSPFDSNHHQTRNIYLLAYPEHRGNLEIAMGAFDPHTTYGKLLLFPIGHGASAD